MTIVFDHSKMDLSRQWNGAIYYSQEIVKYMVPTVKTDRPWVTIRERGVCMDRAIYFIHNNDHPEWYDFLREYKDLILVCGVPSTCDKVRHLGTPIYLPLSVDVQEVKQYRAIHLYDKAYVGRSIKREGIRFPKDTQFLEQMPREELLRKMAMFRKVYAVGRVAIEAKVLGCEVLPFDPRYPDPDFWEILDSRKAAELLQEKLDYIDKR